MIAITFVVAGLGNALYDPALSASILDHAPSAHQARLLGLKSTFGSIGNILGPALVVLFTPFLQAQGIFLAGMGIICVSIFFFLSAEITSRSIRFQSQKTAEESAANCKSAKSKKGISS